MIKKKRVQSCSLVTDTNAPKVIWLKINGFSPSHRLLLNLTLNTLFRFKLSGADSLFNKVASHVAFISIALVWRAIGGVVLLNANDTASERVYITATAVSTGRHCLAGGASLQLHAHNLKD